MRLISGRLFVYFAEQTAVLRLIFVYFAEQTGSFGQLRAVLAPPQVRNNDELCITNDGFCIHNEESCVKNDEFAADRCACQAAATDRRGKVGAPGATSTDLLLFYDFFATDFHCFTTVLRLICVYFGASADQSNW